MSTPAEEAALLAQPLTLPCGLVLPNRLVKAPMEEIIGTLAGDPSEEDYTLYSEWAKGEWGMMITGNVMVSHTHLGSPLDIRVPFPSSPTYSASLAAYTRWAESSTLPTRKTPTIIQLCHSGRQSFRGSGRYIWERSLGPSAVGLTTGPGLLGKLGGWVLWGTPKEMDEKDLDAVVDSFVQGAKVAKETGFDGVEIHASHGYLLAQFMSPNINFRTDSYGGSPRARTKLMFRVVDAIRKELPVESGFCLGIKLNSSDYVKGGLTEEDALDNVKWIAEHGGVDFVEISGGTYESPQMLQEDLETQASLSKTPPSKSSSAREAFFISFASRAHALLASLPLPSATPPPLILVTGGFRTRTGMSLAVSSSSADLIGLGRPACADPHLPLKLLDPLLPSSEARAPKYGIKAPVWLPFFLPLYLPGISTLFHVFLLTQVARGEKPDWQMSFVSGLWRVWLWPGLVGGWRKVEGLVSWVLLLGSAVAMGLAMASVSKK